MQKILIGIYSRYNGNAALKTALPGGLHREMAPQGTAMTYANYNVYGRPDYMLGGTRYEMASIQFDIYAATSALRSAAYEALIALYDDSRPTATGYTSILMERTLEQFVRDGDQNEVRRVVVSYECRYLKS